MNRVKLET
jgi:hypothetical protein